MPDREKVIKALACCVFPVSKGFPYQSHIADEGCEVDECPYRDDCDQMLLDAMELLKEQDPVKPIRLENWWKCSSCSGNIVANMNYCPRCGKAVKWE